MDPGRGGAEPVGPQAVEVQLGGRAVHPPAQADPVPACVGGRSRAAGATRGARNDRLDTGQHQHLVVAAGHRHLAHREAQGVVDNEHARLEPAPSTAPEAHVDAHPARRATTERDRMRQQRIV